ncbi:ATP-binding protein [Aneurinibacillus sp. BA2021]|nr:ATP-binding protein [Aneurinibacillus sp. BA2021]
MILLIFSPSFVFIELIIPLHLSFPHTKNPNNGLFLKVSIIRVTVHVWITGLFYFCIRLLFPQLFNIKIQIILASNKSYIKWGKVFGDEVLATAILDRLMYRVTTFDIKGNPYRLKEKQKAGILPAQVER